MILSRILKTKNPQQILKLTDPLSPASPLTFNVSANFKNAAKSSCLTLASPLYMKSSISDNS